ncbi:Alpha/Beta hydrolase protein [Xylariales sp. PMI_506]|nr:Alpha/Beta hydrolase protein [Xylariales sp. PMI_506]
MDFSRFGVPSEEWTSFANEHPEMVNRAIDKPPKQLQTTFNTARAHLSKSLLGQTGLWKHIHTEDHKVPTRDGAEIKIRLYKPQHLEPYPLHTYIHIHGGGFLFGSLETERYNCTSIAITLSMAVIHICHRHTPQVSGLVPWYDAIDAFEWIMENAAKLNIDAGHVVTGGISAGAALTSAIVHHDLRRSRELGVKPRIQGQVLCAPSLCHRDLFPWDLFASREVASYAQCRDSHILSKEHQDMFQDLLQLKPEDALWNPCIAPDEELRGVPRTALLVCGSDVLRDEALLYAMKLERAGTPVKVHIFPGLPHGFFNFMQLPSHKRWVEAHLECLLWAKTDQGEWVIEKRHDGPTAGL